MDYPELGIVEKKSAAISSEPQTRANIGGPIGQVSSSATSK